MGAFALGSCVRRDDGSRPIAVDVGAAEPEAQSARGMSLFSRECADCHGARGGGSGQVPAVLGPSALPEFPRDHSAAGSFALLDPQELQIRQQTRPLGAAMRLPFRTAQDLYDYLASHIPEQGVDSLKPEDTWALVALMMQAHGGDAPREGIDASNAASLPIKSAARTDHP
jgi:cytochrome c